MEWLFGWFDKIIESYIWQQVLAKFQWVDWFTIVFAIVGIIYGAKKGLLRVTVEALELIVVILAVFRIEPDLTRVILKEVTWSKGYVRLGGFILIAGVVGFAIRLIDARLSKIFHAKLSNPVRGLGGAIVGFCYSMLLWSFFSQAVLMVPGYPKMKRAYDSGGSFSGHYVKLLAPALYNTVAPQTG